MKIISLLPNALFLFILIFCFKFVENGETEEIVKLTTMENDSFAIRYHHQDHCMRHPDYKDLATYRLNFYIKAGYFCDSLLICYPGQLDGNFTKRGAVAGIDYRRNHKLMNYVGEMCENKRNEFCKGRTDSLCLLAKDIPTSYVPWHGIHIHRTADDKNKTILYLSSFSLIYTIGPEEYFSIIIEGTEKELDTYIVVVEENGEPVRVNFTNDDRKAKFFAKNINDGGRLWAHSSLWTLGYDMLPKYLDNTLRFFVERGCNCPMKAWYTREKTLSEKCKEEIKKWYEVTEFGNKRCSITKANRTYNLLGKFNIEINFKIFVNNMNATAEFHLHKNKKCVTMYVYGDKIDFAKSEINGNWSTSKINIMPNENIMTKGMTIYLKIKIFKFYCEFNIGNGTKMFTNKFWYNKWWEIINPIGFEMLVIKGDFILLNLIKETANEEMDKLNLPHSTRIYNNFMAEGSIVTIKGIVNEMAENFEILLLHDAPEFDENVGATVLKLNVSYNAKMNSTMTSYFGGNYKKTEIMDQAKQKFVKNFPFHCEISMKNSGKTKSKFTIYVNNKKCFNYTGEFPFWATNWIKVNGDIDLLEMPFITSPKMDINETNQIFKHELDYLPFNGSMFCIEGFVIPKNKVDGNETIFDINLMHESNDISSKFGDILLKMEFIFKSINYGTQLIEMRSKLLGGRWTKAKKHNNLIGQPGVEFKVTIHVEEYRFGIQVNDGMEYIYYNYTAPPWMVNWIMVKGNVKNVKFDKESQKCQNTLKQQNLPNYITKIDTKNPLKEGNYVLVKGKIEGNLSENVSINFYHEALGWHENKGNVVLQANLTTNQNKVSFCSRIKEKYICNGIVKDLKPKLKKGQIISLVFLINEGKFEIYYADEEIYKYEHKLPVWAIQYIVVTGPLSLVEGKNKFAEIHKFF